MYQIDFSLNIFFEISILRRRDRSIVMNLYLWVNIKNESNDYYNECEFKAIPEILFIQPQLCTVQGAKIKYILCINGNDYFYIQFSFFYIYQIY